MQKINLKKTTKDKLYAMLVELEAENERLRAELDRVKVVNETLKELVQEQSEESCKAEEFAEELAAALKDLDDARAANDKANAELEHLTAVIADRMEDIAREKAAAEGLQREVEKDSIVIAALRSELDRCVEKMLWSEAHPWKNLWRCVTGRGRERI